jgi:hypothetical protein
VRLRGTQIEEQSKSSSEEDDLEREIRAHRKFSLVEAIGRMGGDLLKGASPVSGKRQAELAIEHYLRKHLPDAEGALQVVLQRRVKESEILLKGYEQPFDVLFRVIEYLLDSEERLRRFVGQVDMEWGRLYSERPYFEIEGRSPHAQDPYTLISVRKKLVKLLATLNSSRS